MFVQSLESIAMYRKRDQISTIRLGLFTFVYYGMPPRAKSGIIADKPMMAASIIWLIRCMIIMHPVRSNMRSSWTTGAHSPLIDPTRSQCAGNEFPYRHHVFCRYRNYLPHLRPLTYFSGNEFSNQRER